MPRLFLSSASLRLSVRFHFIPEPVTGEVDKNIFQCWPAERDRFGAIGERLDQPRYPLMAIRLLKADRVVEDHCRNVELLLNFGRQASRILGTDRDRVSANRCL